MIWRLLLTPPMDGADNMALDVALMQRARRTGEAVARVYSWSAPTLSFGRNQRVLGETDASRLSECGLGVVRRPTGGRSLLHFRELTYSVTAPAEESMRASYARINLLLINALDRLGVPASLAGPGPGRSLPPTASPCFAEPAAGELVANGKKLVGSAQWRDAGALLQHGSILVDDDQPRIRDAMRGDLPAVPAAATLRSLLGRAPSPADLAEALRASLRAHGDPTADTFMLETEVLDDAHRLAAEYRDDRWTWRR